MKFKPDWKIALFLFIIALAVFLRVYHFSDWLFFKMDQARDASTIQQAFEFGPGWLPLLGPKAGGTELNLGPAFYYFQYISAVLFQNANPATLAFPDLLFGILSIPLFYFFLRKYFSRDWSMVLASLYAVCFLGIQYSRFSWNPNGLVFFNLLFFLSLLNVFDEKIKYRLRWIISAGVSFAVSTQLHFLSFLTLPVITLVFIALNWKEARKVLNWKHAALFISIVAVVYLPVILNEIVSKGENTTEFIKAVREKPSAHSFLKNVNRDLRYWGQNWFLILTSWISRKGGTNGMILAWLGAIIPALFIGFNFFRREENRVKKKFILITLLWFIIYLLAYIPIAYQIRPRFFLPLLSLPFIYIGYTALFFWEKKKVYWKIIVAAGLLIIFFGNIAGTFAWFKEIEGAQKKGIYPWRTIILKAKDGIVLWHLEKAADYMQSNCAGNKIYYDVSSEYKRPVKYLLGLRGIDAEPIGSLESGNRESCAYDLKLTRSKNKSPGKELEAEFQAGEAEKIGALSVYKLNVREEFFGQALSTHKKGSEENEKTNRIFWKDIVR
ncbi:MAG: glycosyltransferase family 39 protein [Parcubacteria group bacterium]